MLKIGLTGLIGSGKSYIANIFRKYGTPVFDCDHEAKRLYDIYPDLKKKVLTLFDCNDNDNIDKKKLANIVFNDSSKLKQLETLIHPYFIKRYNEWIDEQELLVYPFVIIENAFIFKSSIYKELDYILGVIVDDETRFDRVMKRDNCTKEDVLKRLENQPTPIDLYDRCDYLILGTLSNEMLTYNIIELSKYFISTLIYKQNGINYDAINLSRFSKFVK